MRRHFITSDVFTDKPFGGNPLAVLPNAEGLSTDQMQQIAREFNLSETVFVLRPESPANTRLIRIFVPTREIPFAGHPTIGTALILASLGEIPLGDDRTDIVLETAAGPVPVTVRSVDGRPVSATLTAPQRPQLSPAPSSDVMAAMLSLEPDDIIRAEGASTGNPFLVVQVTDRSALGRSRIDMTVLERIGDGLFAKEPLVFTEDAPDGFDFQARMYAPLSGIPEDPATGSAAAALAGWLGHHDPMRDGTIRRAIAQGIEMGRPSRLEIEVDKAGGEVTAVRVTGSAVLISEGQIEEPPVLPAPG
ncbi:MAG: PhzF family phenazine biosynthesis protein [Geminicoccaceae bacterium]